MVARRIDETTRYDYVPTELKRLHSFARYDKIDGRDKVPTTLNGYAMKWGNPKNWLSFPQIAHFDKIGCFPIPKEELFFVDWDGCINENGTIHPDVLPYIQNTYSEFSTNGKGIKSWYKGISTDNKAITNKDVPWSEYHNSPKDHYGIEIYFQKHFTTVTGNIVPGCPSEINAAPDDLLTRFAKKPKEKKKTAPKENIKKSSREQDNFDIPDGYWNLETWKSWCSQNLTVKEDLGDSLIIECPWEHLHTTPSIKDTKIWYGPPHTFHCFHAHCDGRTWNDVHPVEYKQSRSVEQSIKHLPSYPEITMAEQEDQLAQAALDIKQAIHDHIAADDGTALIIASPPGTGKSHVVADLIVKEEIDTAWMAPTHKIAYSVPTLRAIQHIQTCNEHNCSEPNLHAICGEKGYNTIRSLHKQHKCEFMFQFLKEGSKVYMQQYYKSRWPSSHSLVVNDEANLPDWLTKRKITIPQLQKVDAYKTPDSEDSHFLRAWQATMTDLADSKPVHGKPILDRLNQTGQLENWLGILIKKYSNTLPATGIDLDNDSFDEAMHLHSKPDVIIPHLVKALANEIVQWQSGKQWNSRIQIKRDPSGEVAIYITEPRELIAPKGERFPTFVHLDATIDEEIHSKLFGKEIKVLRTPINPAPGMDHLGVRTGNLFSKTTHEAKPKNGKPNETLVRTIKIAKRMLKKVDPNREKKVALISHMGSVDEIGEALKIPQDRTGYYWNVRGSNDFETCDILLLIGTPSLDPHTIATMARSLWFDDPEPIYEDWTRENGYADPRMKHLATFLTNSELTQAAHRIRPIRHANKTVISMCEGDIGFLPLTETFNVIPDLNEEGENLHDVHKEASQEKLNNAYEELSKNNSKVKLADLASKAGVRKQTASAWMQENVTPNVNTQSTEEIGGSHGSRIIDYIEPRELASNLPSNLSKEGQEPMINPDDIQRYHGIEKGAKVITPLGQGTVVLIRGIGPRQVRVTVSVDRLGWKSFKSEEVKPFIQARQEPLPANAGLDALFAGIGG